MAWRTISMRARVIATTAGEVARVTVNGSSISADETFEQIGLGINGAPLGGRIRVDYNEVRPHSSLNDLTPRAFGTEEEAEKINLSVSSPQPHPVR